MPIIKELEHLMISDTKFITMTAFRDGPRDDTVDPKEVKRDWYLTVNMSGACIEFLAAEGMQGYMVTYDEAFSRIAEFEANMQAENQDYVQNLVKIMMNKLGADDENK